MLKHNSVIKLSVPAGATNPFIPAAEAAAARETLS